MTLKIHLSGIKNPICGIIDKISGIFEIIGSKKNFIGGKIKKINGIFEVVAIIFFTHFYYNNSSRKIKAIIFILFSFLDPKII